MKILSKSQIIFQLQQISFVCVDVVDENHGDYVWVEMVRDNPEMGIKFLSKHMKRWKNYPNTIKSFEQFCRDKTWDSFHTTNHYLMVDKIIHFLETGDGDIEEAVNQSLRCGVASEEFIESILAYTMPQTSAAA